jgi:putative tryptophan/tyrosine transport system substrate-binding protein
VTGIFLDAPEIAGKWIQIIREVAPKTRSVALLFDLHLDQTQLKSGENIARKIGIETLRLGIDQPGEFRLAFQRAAEATVDAMLVHSSPVFVDQAAAIAELALEFRMPTIGLFPIYAKVGGPFSYGPNNFEQAGRWGGWQNSSRGKPGGISHSTADLLIVPDQSSNGQTATDRHSAVAFGLG